MKNNYPFVADVPVSAAVEFKCLDSDTITRTVRAVTQLTSGNIFIINNETLNASNSHDLFLENETQKESAVNDKILRSICHLFSDFLSQIPVNRRLEYSVSYDFNVVDQSGKTILYHHKITPLSLNPDGKIEMSLCNASVSLSKSPGNIIISSKLSDVVWKFCKENNKWQAQDKIKLTTRETDIVRFYLQGYTIEEIAAKLFITGATVKWHRRKLFEKLNVKNITEAISCLVLNSLL